MWCWDPAVGVVLVQTLPVVVGQATKKKKQTSNQRALAAAPSEFPDKQTTQTDHEALSVGRLCNVCVSEDEVLKESGKW